MVEYIITAYIYFLSSDHTHRYIYHPALSLFVLGTSIAGTRFPSSTLLYSTPPRFILPDYSKKTRQSNAPDYNLYIVSCRVWCVRYIYRARYGHDIQDVSPCHGQAERRSARLYRSVTIILRSMHRYLSVHISLTFSLSFPLSLFLPLLFFPVLLQVSYLSHCNSKKHTANF